MPQVTKLFEITFEEPDKDWLNPTNLAMVLGAAFSDNEDEFYKFNIRDLTNQELYTQKFALATANLEEAGSEASDSVVVPEEQYDEKTDEKPPVTDIQKRNDELRKKGDEKKVGPTHSAPGTGKPCENPEMTKEKVRRGGSITFCASCGYQYADTDLIKG